MGWLHPKTGKRVSYCHVETDADGWVDSAKWLPRDFDIVSLKIEGIYKILSGWLNCNGWDGLKIDPNYKVIAWKKKRDMHYERSYDFDD